LLLLLLSWLLSHAMSIIPLDALASSATSRTTPHQPHVHVHLHVCSCVLIYSSARYVKSILTSSTKLDGVRHAAIDGAYAYVIAKSVNMMTILDIC
jgi:hypothetical protein